MIKLSIVAILTLPSVVLGQAKFLLPRQGSIFSTGNSYDVSWLYNTINTPYKVDLTLLDFSQQPVTEWPIVKDHIAFSPPATNVSSLSPGKPIFYIYTWMNISMEIPSNDHYAIQIKGFNAAGNLVTDLSPLFSIRNVASVGDPSGQEGQLTIDKPDGSEQLKPGLPLQIIWKTSGNEVLRQDLVTIKLYQIVETASQDPVVKIRPVIKFIADIAVGVYNEGIYDWKIPASTVAGKYTIEVALTIDGDQFKSRSVPFLISK